MYIVSCATNLEIEIILIRLYHSPHITPVIPYRQNYPSSFSHCMYMHTSNTHITLPNKKISNNRSSS